MFFPQIVAFDAEIIPKDAPHFESLVARLVPRSNLGAHFDCHIGLEVGRSLDKLREITVVSPVRLDSLIAYELVDKIFAENFDVGPRTRLKWPVSPHDVTGPDANSNLLSNTRSLELVAIVGVRKGVWLQDGKIGAVDRHEAVIANVVNEPIFPYNLQKEASVSRRIIKYSEQLGHVPLLVLARRFFR
jgi:hypothetical protein